MLRSSLAVLGLLIVLLAAALGAALAWSTRGWTREQSVQTGAFLEGLVLASYRARGSLQTEAIAAATLPHLGENTYLLVSAPDGSLIFGWRRGERIAETAPGAGQSFLARHADDIRPTELRVEARLIGTIAAGVLSFTEDETNRRFLESLALTAAAGAGLSFLLALGVAWLSSARLARHAVALAGGLVRLASGERGVRFPVGGARELAEIGRSAQVLQGHLAREETIRQQWAADVAHDLRTPIAALRAQIEAMTDGVLSPTPDRLEQASRELGRVEALVADLAELSRMESPDMRPTRVPLGAQRLAAELRERFALEAERGGVHLTCDGESGLTLRADPHLLGRALDNVIQNAIRHAGTSGYVTVGVSARPADGAGPAPAAVIRVENTGNVPSGDLERVFDRLFRGEGSRSTRGSGLGLSIARAVVRLHGGSIAMSNTDHGTVLVEIRLPA